MATYIVLGSFTDQGIRNIKGTGKRVDVVRDMARQFGITVKDVYWTLGSFDAVLIVEAPDEAAVTALGLAIGAMGNVRTQTLRAFTAEEMSGILGRLP